MPYPTAEEIATLSEDEFLELCRDSDRISSEYDFKEAGMNALFALGNGALSIGFMLSDAFLGAVPNAVLAGVSVWRGIQNVGEGVRHAARSSSADTALRILCEHPGGVIHEPQMHGRVTSAVMAGMTR
jgi:hypothetical protein